ncbi:flagellar filament capping protein FliD [Planomonospora algeriensis]
MTNSIDGLVSGLSTSSLISQLMQVEAAPQTQLRTKVTAQEKVQSSYQSINTRLAALKTAAEAMFADATWTGSKASSSSAAVTAVGTTGAAAATLKFDVDRLAQAQVRTVSFASATTPVLATDGDVPPITGVSIKIGTGDPVDIALAADKNTPQGLADAINAKKLDVRAAVVTTDQGTVLQLTSTKTGMAAAFELVGVARATSTFATAATSALADGATSVGITVGGGSQVDVAVTPTGAGGVATAQDVATAINNAGISGVKAKVTTATNGATTLEVFHTQASGNGADPVSANTISVTGLAVGPTATRTGFAGTANIAVAAQDAKITVGAGTAGAYTVTSGSNSFTGVMQGVTLTANKVETGVTVTSSPDSDAVASKMQAFVDAANAVLSEIGSQTAYNSTAKTKQPLTGNFAVRQVAQTILSQVGYGQEGYGSFAQIGVQLDKAGKLAFSKDTFLKAYAADPDKVKSAVTAKDPVLEARVDAQGNPVPKTEVTQVMGLAEKLTIIVNNSTTTITSAIKGGESLLTDYKKRIDAWNLRLERREEALRKQFTNLEVALGKMNQQSSWLAGQIASLPQIENGS